MQNNFLSQLQTHRKKVISLLLLIGLLFVIFKLNSKTEPAKPQVHTQQISVPSLKKKPKLNTLHRNSTLLKLIDDEISKKHLQIIELKLNTHFSLQFQSTYKELQHLIKLLEKTKTSCPLKFRAKQKTNTLLLTTTLSCQNEIK